MIDHNHFSWYVCAVNNNCENVYIHDDDGDDDDRDNGNDDYDDVKIMVLKDEVCWYITQIIVIEDDFD